MAVVVVADGRRGLSEALSGRYDVVLLDLMLPAKDGLEVCREVRARSDVPIIVLTARGEEADRVMGLELGADDYLAKPFSPRELLARIRAVTRRAKGRAGPPQGQVKVGGAAHRPGGADGHARRPGDPPHRLRVRPAGGAGPPRRPGADAASS